ncbi:1-deoxy-D-xylulose-5-phosphate reductoisomerase [Polynucleobacter paneuropaeus]|jgi:1-deoxy-D-xylulose-5-phosphate reductoisomerase|uniref:1-deoxy-D-xylulose 5-phosphate reductoisomerase n=1 Tax=Polynucleobacter paneuropaeus TaxID=2527775 RepID=A0A2Z4JT99_9BURK|nr:1-deoxy-D-xylulose-5-phosphate reductoisomerase [Polynucleobacter paneuropaeus]AWW49996.1 1-deoxy-D-xylulose-5-phosphate reductoisomerase [Polynucleobacter paneuropaeus]MBT8581507.1 1-deoxy-D-xylulose-5-phosphate reductoisomerase [Polynucleobacter paneuropaeus]MBT8610534.1 1-deoxy-D-xylulose-5-phosphate reductoisomerase [Polynucleobacter paneuropaeus]MBT8636804.1 1-deoxy-D-xylulose-5-phosphate reductoisomerase [Polynucleobacter paneuropaeus]MBT8638740.1 1-deoxy-D-xylulose-5-phosphate reduct
MTSKRRIAILGSTGSIGTNTLDVIRAHPERFEVVALTAAKQVERLAEQCVEFKPRVAVVSDAGSAKKLSELLLAKQVGTQVLYGPDALITAVLESDCDTVMAAIVGAAGLLPTLAAAKAGKRILLANKEALVMSGNLFMDAVRQGGGELLPIDSEHNAIFQCLPVHYSKSPSQHHGVEELWLTASGGPFRNTPIAELSQVTPEQACAHPNWVMGRKISVDSATMMNKGLEVIEAYWLFGLPIEKIQVLIHPQSVVHSMVRYCDGSVIAQMGQPDMRTPIAYGLAWPDRITAGVQSLSLTQQAALNFMEPDLQRFPCLSLAFQAGKQGGTAPVILNAANEIAVAAFLDNALQYLQIPEVVERVLNTTPPSTPSSLEDILEVDAKSRVLATDVIQRLHS